MEQVSTDFHLRQEESATSKQDGLCACAHQGAVSCADALLLLHGVGSQCGTVLSQSQHSLVPTPVCCCCCSG